MKTLLAGIGSTTLVVGLLFLIPLLGALGGAFSGWVVGWFFTETITTFMAALGIKGLAMWQIGMGLGFVGGFFKSTSINNKS